jgi:Uma2 family endonuclease
MSQKPHAPNPPAARQFRPWRLTVAKYQRMIDAGIVTEQDRVFLWKGLLLERTEKGRPHVVVLSRLAEVLGALVRVHAYHIETQSPTSLLQREDTLPEPDLIVVRGSLGDYADYPTTRDVPLIVEVADDLTRNFDMEEKPRLFAMEAVTEYWVADVVGRSIDVFTEPSGPQGPIGYRSRRRYVCGDSIPVHLDGNLVGHFPVDDIA